MNALRSWTYTLSVVGSAVLGGCMPAPVYCDDSCSLASDGACDDGSAHATTGLCAPGTDCSDCGPNHDASPPAPLASPTTGVGSFGRRSGESTVVVSNCSDDWVPGWYCNGTTEFVYRGKRVIGEAESCFTAIAWYCGDGRRCVTSGSPDSPAIGCLLDGYTTLTDRVVRCEVVGYCDNDVELRRCVDLPVLLPIPAGPSGDIAIWYEMGSLMHRIQERSDVVPQPDTFVFGSQDHMWCRRNGGTRWCGPTRCPDDVPPPTGPSASCRAAVDSARLPPTGNSCIDRCWQRFVDCAYANDCATLTSCQNSTTTCVRGCL